MSISSKKTTDVDQIDEMSSMAGGAVEGGAAFNRNEDKLREMIRKSIKLYSKKKNKPKKENVQEQKLRNIIKKIIIEAKESSLAQPTSTLEGILRSFFNSSGIYETVRDEFYQLATHRDEKIGFIRTFLERSNEALQVPSADAENEQDGEPEEDLQEEEAEEDSREDKILKKWDAFVPAEIEKEKVVIKKKKEAEKKEKDKKPEEPEIEDYTARGSSAAREVMEQRVQSELEKILSKLIGEEKERARVSILQNFAAWFDMWTEDSDEMTQFLASTLEANNVPVPEQLQEPEAAPSDLGEPEEQDMVPDNDDGEEIVAGDVDDAEPDLMELLDGDLE